MTRSSWTTVAPEVAEAIDLARIAKAREADESRAAELIRVLLGASEAQLSEIRYLLGIPEAS